MQGGQAKAPITKQIPKAPPQLTPEGEQVRQDMQQQQQRQPQQLSPGVILHRGSLPMLRRWEAKEDPCRLLGVRTPSSCENYFIKKEENLQGLLQLGALGGLNEYDALVNRAKGADRRTQW